MNKELSKKSINYIPKHRYYELKHFCLQYPNWVTERAYMYQLQGIQYSDVKCRSVDPIFARVEKMEKMSRNIDLIDECVSELGELAPYILRGVTQAESYDTQAVKYGPLPCCRETYYQCYRKFFRLLDTRRE